jgi:Domain of unknown function (DUF4430)
MTFRLAPALASAALIALAGCGLGPGRTPRGVELTVTRDFGARTLLQARAPRAHGEETVMSLLERNAKIATRYGGGFVQSIDGLSGGSEAGDPVDWFYYVNGLEATRGAAETTVHPGERIWWDRHDWGQAETVPAVVGSFPEPFLTGIAGKRLPVRVECVEPSEPACRTALDRLRAARVPAALAAASGAYSPQTLRLLVGPFGSIAADPAAHRLEQGPRASGVYARFAPSGASVTLLDARGRATRTLGPGTGLVAAIRQGEDAPVWLVTGTDRAGVARASRALEEAALRDRFALALAPGGAAPLPDRA